MRQIDNWDSIEERKDGEFEMPTPGGYIAIITRVEDVEEKQYLMIEWDYAEGKYKGENQATFTRAGFWPCRFCQSYKETAIGFFKGFKTSVEVSNPGYVFRTNNVQSLVGKKFGVVTGEEEYRKNDGSIGTRLRVVQKRSIAAIQNGDFKVPKKKLLSDAKVGAGQPSAQNAAQSSYNFSMLDDNDGDLPF